jgi:hypothetical protein
MTYRMRSFGLVALPLWIQRLGLSLVTASAFTLVACGGGGGDDNASPSALDSGAPPSLQSLSTDEQTSVSISSTTSTSTTTGTTTTQIMRTAALDFEGKVNAGPSKGTELKGKLQLNAKSTDGGKNFDVTGTLVQRNSMTENDPQLTDDQKAQINAALKKFYDSTKMDYEKFRLGVSALVKANDALLKVQREAWAAVPAGAPDAQAQYQAITDKVKTILDEFNKQLDALQATLTKALLAEIKAIKPGGNTSTMADITVTGTLTQDGKIMLTFDLGDGAKIVGTGQSDAKGKYTGAFTGPAAGDIGTWSANPILCQPIPPTVPGTTTTMPTPTGTMPTPTGTIPGTTNTTTTTPNPTSTVPTTPTGTGTVTVPTPGADTCSGRIAVGAEISEVISASVIKVGKGISIGQYENGIPFDVGGAKLVGGTAADFKVGKWVQVCSDDTISAITASSPPPLKASKVIFK